MTILTVSDKSKTSSFSISFKNPLNKPADIYIISKNKVIFLAYQFFYNFLYNRCISIFSSHQIYYINIKEVILKERDGDFLALAVMDFFDDYFENCFGYMDIIKDCSYYLSIFSIAQNIFNANLEKNIAGDSLLNFLILIYKKTEMVEALVTLKPNVNNQSACDLCSPLHIAGYQNQIEIVDILLKNKADVNAQNRKKEIPLHHALSISYKGQEERNKEFFDTKYAILEKLIEAGSNLKLKNCDGSTPQEHFKFLYSDFKWNINKEHIEFYNKVLDLLTSSEEKYSL